MTVTEDNNVVEIDQYGCRERIEQLIIHSHNHCCDICPWTESQTIKIMIVDVVVGNLLKSGQCFLIYDVLTMVNRQD